VIDCAVVFGMLRCVDACTMILFFSFFKKTMILFFVRLDVLCDSVSVDTNNHTLLYLSIPYRPLTICTSSNCNYTNKLHSYIVYAAN